MVKNDIKVFTIDSGLKVGQILKSLMIYSAVKILSIFEIIVREKQLNAKPFSKSAKDKIVMSADSYLTMDLETVDMNGNIVPYLACA